MMSQEEALASIVGHKTKWSLDSLAAGHPYPLCLGVPLCSMGRMSYLVLLNIKMCHIRESS